MLQSQDETQLPAVDPSCHVSCLMGYRKGVCIYYGSQVLSPSSISQALSKMLRWHLLGRAQCSCVLGMFILCTWGSSGSGNRVSLQRASVGRKGHWIGQGIGKSVAVAQLPRSFLVTKGYMHFSLSLLFLSFDLDPLAIGSHCFSFLLCSHGWGKKTEATR